MKSDWAYFYKILLESIAKIDPAYFELERYKDVPAIRERVYCYELYHQLRAGLKPNFKYKLHGEIDKSGHDWIINLFGGLCPNPDFVVHTPGDRFNLAVIEVKRSKSHIGEIKDDIQKLLTFIKKVNYYRGILLIFGPDEIENLGIPDKRIIALWHKEPSQIPKPLGERLRGQEGKSPRGRSEVI
jgi:hypothetical protein